MAKQVSDGIGGRGGGEGSKQQLAMYGTEGLTFYPLLLRNQDILTELFLAFRTSPTTHKGERSVTKL
jgi:hypothetical protein